MSFTKLNRSAATLTKNRTEGSISPFSGMCVTCVDGCIGMCEIGKSAYRGPRCSIPQPLHPDAGARRKYPYDCPNSPSWARPSAPMAAKPTATRPPSKKVTTRRPSARDKDIKLKLPLVVPGLGSTKRGQNNWEGLAIERPSAAAS